MKRLHLAAGRAVVLGSLLCLTPIAGGALAVAPDAASRQAAAVQPAAVETEPVDPIVQLVRERLATARPSGDAAGRADTAALVAYYAAHQGSPLWVNSHGPTARATAAIDFIARADDWGLDARAFSLPDLPRGRSEPPTFEALADAEGKLSLAVLKYARYAQGGRIPDPTSSLASTLDRKPRLTEPARLLDDIAGAASVAALLEGLHPRHPQFKALRQALETLRAASAVAMSLAIPAGPGIKPLERHRDIAILRKRMGLPAPTLEGLEIDDWVFDAALVGTVKAYQASHQLKADGIVNDRLRASLNARPSLTPQRIIANMEEWRWMPEALGASHVSVNIPEFAVRVIRDGRLVHTERVVTGKTAPETQTPVFSELMRTIVFQPQWGLPESIKVNEILPRLQRGDGLRAGFKMQRGGRDVDPDAVDWSRADIRNYLVYQPAGDDNALGVVKFLFPNKHQVYLHDTPTKGLFNAATRTFSHGCVRVRNPVRLAELLLQSDKGWKAADIDQLVNEGPEDNRIALERPVPVHITYFTAVAGDDGELKTFADVYGHEKRITLALAGRWNDIDRPEDHLAPITVETSGDNVRPAPRRAARADWDAPRRNRAASSEPGFQPSGGGGRARRGESVNDIINHALSGR